MSPAPSFFVWQQRALATLLDWGVANVVVGAGLATQRQPVLRHFGIQAASWGAIDALLALSGRLGARRHTATAPLDEQQRSAKHFRTIVAINAGLDVGYVAGGLWLARRRGSTAHQQGAGLGIAFQGAFLLLYDLALVAGITRWLASTR